MKTEFTETQKRALAVATVVALAFGAYFLRGYFMLIVVAAVAAYLFNPLFDWFLRRFGRGLSVTLTLLAAIFAVIIPLGLLDPAGRGADQRDGPQRLGLGVADRPELPRRPGAEVRQRRRRQDPVPRRRAT